MSPRPVPPSLAILLSTGLLICGPAVSGTQHGSPGGPLTLGAPVCSTGALWSFQTAQQFIPEVASGAAYGIDLNYVSAGTTIYAVRAETGGTIAWSVPAPMGVTYQNAPIVARLSFGRGTVVLSTTSEGRIICLDAVTGAIRWLSPRVRRPTCSDDTIIGSPAVQLWDASNAAFRVAVPDDDLVFAVTRYECGETTDNRAYAFNGSSGTVRWIFNETGTNDLDYASEGPSVDLARNQLYFGTNRPDAAPAQNTLWALSTLNGSRVWSVNHGSIRTRPQLIPGTQRVCAGTLAGQLVVVDPATGALRWSMPVSPNPAATIERNLWAESRPPYANQVFVVDSDGFVRAVRDPGGVGPGVVLWTSDASLRVTTSPVASPPLGKVYVGLDNGTVHQLNLDTGADEAPADVQTGTLATSVAFDLVGAGPEENRLVAAAGGRVRRFCIPWGITVAVEDPGDGAGTLEPAMTVAPNPFAGRTLVRYFAPRESFVRLAVYDLRGRQVTKLFEGVQTAGWHAAEWNGRDAGGRKVGIGAYYCRLEVSGAAGTRRLVLVR
jgi:outer membrane protein assembly factor BamB